MQGPGGEIVVPFLWCLGSHRALKEKRQTKMRSLKMTWHCSWIVKLLGQLTNRCRVPDMGQASGNHSKSSYLSECIFAGRESHICTDRQGFVRYSRFCKNNVGSVKEHDWVIAFIRVKLERWRQGLGVGGILWMCLEQHQIQKPRGEPGCPGEDRRPLCVCV